MDQTYWFAIIGFAMSPVISFLKAKKWSAKAKALASIGICTVAAGVQAIAAGGVHSVSDFVSNWATIWAASQVIYHTWFGNTPWNSALEDMGVN